MKDKYVIFDLDDTLFYEIDYLKSAYKEIAYRLDNHNSEGLAKEMYEWHGNGKNVFELLVERYLTVSKNNLLDWYRNHIPNIKLIDGASDLLINLKSKGYGLGLITDGRSVTQRSKLRALGIEDIFDLIIISEEFGSSKPDRRNFLAFVEDANLSYFYIADNLQKDFVTPNALGWSTIALKDKGINIHQQDFEIPEEFRPKFVVERLVDVLEYIK